MRRRPRRRAVLLLVASATVLSGPGLCHGRSLADRLNDVVTEHGLTGLNPSVAFVPILTRLAIRSADYPTVSTTPDFAYNYNFETATFERTAQALSSILLERTETVGGGALELGVAAFASDAGEEDGHALTGVVSRFSVAKTIGFGPGGFELASLPVVLRFDHFSLRTAGVFLSGTYGLTDRWDVNLLVPVLVTTLDVAGGHEAVVEGVGGHVSFDRIAIDDTRAGVGDVQLRTKYRLGSRGWADVAVGTSLRAPTGSRNDFQGLGDWTVTPFLVLTRTVGPHDVHLNLGMEANGSVLERSRVRYGIGASIRLVERLSLLLDVLGSSGVASEGFLAGRFTVLSSNGQNDQNDQNVRAQVRALGAMAPRTDIVDLGVGFKGKLARSITGFVAAIVPLTQDGLRSDVVPLGGVEVAF